MSILDNTCFGPFQFETAGILRNSLLINGILTNSEVWYNLTKAETEELEELDEILIRRILETGKCTPKAMLYLEMGFTPIRFIIMKRRIMFLHEILHQEKGSLLFRFFQAQYNDPVRGDWWLTVRDDMENLGINLSLDQISQMSKFSLKQVVGKKADAKALQFLNSKKGNKCIQVSHKKLEIQKYLMPNPMSNIQRKFLFQLRSRMLDLKVNFQGSHQKFLCELCKNHQDDQKSLLICSQLDSQNSLVESIPKYEDIFDEKPEVQIKIVSILQEKFKLRKHLLAEKKNK